MKTRIKAFVAACLLVLVTGVVVARWARASSTIADTAASPLMSFTSEGLLKFWSNQAASRGVTNDPQWNTAMQTIFSPANFPGVDAQSLAFLRSFFIQIVHVGP